MTLESPAESGTGRVAEIAATLGLAPRIHYEAAHVYPMSAPAFEPRPGAERERPGGSLLRLYVHVPFCNYGCTFCFYAKRVGADRELMERYVRAVERELSWAGAGKSMPQLYVGGGTPTVLPADLLDRLLDAIFARLTREEGASHTVESSPESVSEEHLRVLRAHGIERVSMGIQSLDPAVLDAAHRRHGPEQALGACERLVSGGFVTNVDLMYGLPRQSQESFRRDLAAVAERGVHTVTLYGLRLNEHTPLRHAVEDAERLELPRLVAWREFVERTAGELGFTQTRWHTFRRDDFRGARYERAPCIDGFGAGYQLGVGVSAASHLGFTVYRNHTRLETYLAAVEAGRSPVEGVFPLEESDRKTLFVARSLGDGRPLHRGEYEQAFGGPVERDFPELVPRLVAAGLLLDEHGQLELSRTGRLVYDLVTLAFYPAHARRWLAERQGHAAGAGAPLA
jgi:oxygen-independent coproporphyrinogen-3 oxidase